jgi:hypothetical protein
MEKKANNSITDRSYFTRRLRNSGWAVDNVVEKYPTYDKRAWTVILSRNNDNVFITCKKDDTFNFYDGMQFFDDSANRKVNHSTKSIEVIYTILADAGMHTKHYTYGQETVNDETDEESENRV